VFDRTLVPGELLDVLLKRPDFHSFDYLGTYFIRFNVTKKPFDDPRVRRALALAIDKDRIVTKIMRAGEKPAATLVPPGTTDYTSPPGLGYDPALAGNCCPRPAIRAARVFQDLNTCSTRRPRGDKCTRTSPSSCSKCGAIIWASRWICGRSSGKSC